MDSYRKYVTACACAAASLFAYVLAVAIPANFAAMVGGIFGLLVTKSLDPVGEKFKTDVERILEPNKPAAIALLSVAICILLTISTLAGVTSPAVAAPLGLLIGLALAERFFQK